MAQSRQSLALTCCMAALLTAPAPAQISIVAPQNRIDSEGDASAPDDFAGTPFRVQFLYEAEDFATLPDNTGSMIGFVLRPDASLTRPQSLSYDDIEIRFSTTERSFDDLDIVFEDNIGEDEVLVYEGELEVTTQAAGPANGPREFDYVYGFDTPFAYDPSQGNLLMDVISFSGQSRSQIEDQDSSIIGVFAGDPLGDVGELLAAGLVAEFLFDAVGIPGDFDFDGILAAADIDLLSAEVRSGNNTPSFDLNADAKVDEMDRVVWVDDLKRTYFGDSDLDGQFNSSDFVFVFQAGEYEDGVVGNSTWATGDWDGDTEFSSGDFVIAFQAGGFEAGPRPVVAVVPEPSGVLLLSIGIMLWRRRTAV